MRPIDADNLISVLDILSDKGGDIRYWEQLKTIVDSMPTADVQEIKRGRWIIDREFGNDVMSDEQMVICSVCGKGIFWGKQNYCPNCGAYMRGENNG